MGLKRDVVELVSVEGISDDFKVGFIEKYTYDLVKDLIEPKYFNHIGGYDCSINRRYSLAIIHNKYEMLYNKVKLGSLEYSDYGKAVMDYLYGYSIKNHLKIYHNVLVKYIKMADNYVNGVGRYKKAQVYRTQIEGSLFGIRRILRDIGDIVIEERIEIKGIDELVDKMSVYFCFSGVEYREGVPYEELYLAKVHEDVEYLKESLRKAEEILEYIDKEVGNV